MEVQVVSIRDDGTRLGEPSTFEYEEFQEWYEHFVDVHGMCDGGGILVVTSKLMDNKKVHLKADDNVIYKLSHVV